MILQTWTGFVCSKPKNQPTTAVVKVVQIVKHEKYGKYLKKVSKYIAHDEMNCPVGTEVVIQATPRKISKTKSKEIVRRVR